MRIPLLLLLIFLVQALSGCVSEPAPLSGEDDPWAVLAWTCGDGPYPMTQLLVLHGDGRLVHLDVWQGGHGETERDGDPELSEDAALRVAERADATGVFDLDRHRPQGGSEGVPHFRHVEAEQVSRTDQEDLAEKATRADFPSLEPRYFGGDEETDGGHSCTYRVGVQHDGSWPQTALNPLDSAGPEPLRVFVRTFLHSHLPPPTRP